MFIFSSEKSHNERRTVKRKREREREGRKKEKENGVSAYVWCAHPWMSMCVDVLSRSHSLRTKRQKKIHSHCVFSIWKWFFSASYFLCVIVFNEKKCNFSVRNSLSCYSGALSSTHIHTVCHNSFWFYFENHKLNQRLFLWTEQNKSKQRNLRAVSSDHISQKYKVECQHKL